MTEWSAAGCFDSESHMYHKRENFPSKLLFAVTPPLMSIYKLIIYLCILPLNHKYIKHTQYSKTINT